MTLTALQRKHSQRMKDKKKPNARGIALSPSTYKQGLNDYNAFVDEVKHKPNLKRYSPHKAFNDHA